PAYATHELSKRVVVPESERISESDPLKAFLHMNPEEGFDLEALNSTDTKTLGKEALRNKHLSQQVMRKVEELLPRVRAETEDPALARALLRNKTLDWYKRSPGDRTWGDKMPPRGTKSRSRISTTWHRGPEPPTDRSPSSVCRSSRGRSVARK